MEFKTKYPEGNWTTEKTLFDARDMIYDGHGNVVCRSGMNSYSEIYTKAILQIPAMFGCMIERAEKLHSFLYSGMLSEKNAKRVYKDEAEELEQILSILRDAGVEVVE